MAESIVKVFADTSTPVRAVAEQFTGAARRAVASQGRYSVVLAGGGTPQALYKRLAQPPSRDRLPWPQMHFFWGDERCVPPEHAESNYGQAWRALLGQAAVAAENIHRIRGEWTPAEAAADYVQLLHACAALGERWPRFDWVFLGLGADGHTASLFPGSPWP